ncbi:Uncharacterised protein [Serratia liquefaciens]|jgi:hypothetical protein|uniref:DUF2513 domain-containing protein n=1 Tax=Serratia plymuthica TaxID=82996 RepID=A0A318NRL9_SERPL|nr:MULTISPECIES: DUF2513 domain-containing protein [Serratia]AGO56590.1 hypothetical protein SOD_c36320 [Serratia plymuthica 4Rx13]PYD36444.1 DUF2513 domain-containing protein [Serratia plymuthica]CAI0959258.1 Uncharacterised protein [Serratia liquefaciens]CAI1125206.1 Uncharacterised protein [Serratia liquefaciens]
MKIDQQYLKNLLIGFEDSDGPDTMLGDLTTAGFDRNDPNFIFHMRLLYDNGLILRVDGKAGFGHEMSRGLGKAVSYSWIDTPLRLTARGHDFIADLRQQEVWQTIKTNFKDEGISTLMGLSKSLAMGYAKKKVKDLTGMDID